jgi:hypothetical protein
MAGRATRLDLPSEPDDLAQHGEAAGDSGHGARHNPTSNSSGGEPSRGRHDATRRAISLAPPTCTAPPQRALPHPAHQQPTHGKAVLPTTDGITTTPKPRHLRPTTRSTGEPPAKAQDDRRGTGDDGTPGSWSVVEVSAQRLKGGALVLLAGEEFAEVFRSFESSAFRMETLDFYDVEEERQGHYAFLARQDIPAAWTEPNPWVSAMIDGGKTLQRVHIVGSPLTNYLRFELGWAYPAHLLAGEDIRILDLANAEVPGLPDHDFLLLDDARVYRMHYTGDRQFAGAEPLEPEALPLYQGYRDVALKHAIPFEEYWKPKPA